MVSFVLSGDVGAIKASAKTWGQFGQTTQSAATQVDCLHYGEFLGSEGVTFSAGVKDDMVPHLNRTSGAWTIVSTALSAYATTLDTLQSRLHALGIKHAAQQSTVNSANASYTQSKADDTQHSKDLKTQKSSLKDGQTMPPDTYYSQTGSAHSNLTTAQADLTSIETQATAIHGEHKRALHHVVGQVHKAKNMRIVHPPGRLSRMAHSFAGAFKKGISWAAKNLSPVLKTISAIAGVLALIPGLDVVMGPLALATGAAALAIDVLNKLVNGKGSWLQMGIDTVGLLPGVKSLSAFGKVGRLSSATSKFGNGLRALEAEGGKAAKFFTAADYTNSAVTTAQST